MASGAGDRDILRSTHSSKLSAYTMYEKTPFWPYVFKDGAGALKVRFNPGYVIDYNNQTGDKILSNLQSTFRPTNMDTNFTISSESGSKFYLEITTSGTNSAISSVQIVQSKEDPASVDDWHFGSINVLQQGYELVSNDKFRIPMALFDEATGEIKEVCLRENIHYQMTHFENRPGGDARVLKSWGESRAVFGENPPVQFRSIKGVSPIYVLETPDIIYIGYDTSTSGGSGSGTSTGTPTASGKSAIVPYKNTYISWWCAEAPEPYFFEVIKTSLNKRETKRIPIEDRFIKSCEPKTIDIWSVSNNDQRVKIKAEIKGRWLIVKNFSWFRKAENVRIIIGGVVKGLSGLRYKEQSDKVYEANKLFYSLAHNPSFKPSL